MTMQQKITRRALVKGSLVAGGWVAGLGLIATTAVAGGNTPLDPNDPMTKALGFVSDATNVNAAENTSYKAGQKCGTCAWYQGKAGDATAACNMFAGHIVPRGGWCKVWAVKTAE